MARRTPKSKPDTVVPDITTKNPPAEPQRKVRSGGRTPGPRDVAAEMASGQDQAAGMSDQFVGSANGGEEAVQSAAPSTESISMSSEPSAEDIRMRAYHRYLERGGGHGMDFEDWLAAERELKAHH